MPPTPSSRRALLGGAALAVVAGPLRAGLAAPAAAPQRAGAEAPTAGPLRADLAMPMRGPAQAAGALVWVHAHYTEGDPPPAPAFLLPLADASWDLWRLDRMPGRDPLAPGAGLLAQGTAALRAQGYRQVAAVGESRGAFIIAVALRHAALADAVLLLAPAAHGTRAERRAQALADWREAFAAAAPGTVRRAGLVLFQGDPYDPDPPARAEAFTAGMRAAGAAALLVDRPVEPTGHGGARDPAFDARFGPCLRALLAGTGGAGCG